MRTIEDMVKAEVHANATQLVEYCLTRQDDSDYPFDRDDLYSALCPMLADLTENQIDELAAEHNSDMTDPNDGRAWEELDLDEKIAILENLRVEPEQREIMQWWAVSDWLAERLREQGAIVVSDGYTEYWARTISGEAIADDGVICAVYASLHKPRD